MSRRGNPYGHAMAENFFRRRKYELVHPRRYDPRYADQIAAGKNEIVEKGIGFKSVFCVSDKVLIRSVWFSFLQSSHLPYGQRAFRGH